MAADLLDYKNPTYDDIAKRFLSKKSILAWILKRVVPEFRSLSIEEIIPCIESEPQLGQVAIEPDYTDITGRRNEDTSPTEGRITFDILFHAFVPGSGEPIKLIINLEAQKDRPTYPLLTRAVYYASRLISAQKNVEFTHSDYSDIKKVYTIWLTMRSPDGESSINYYYLHEKHLLGQRRENPAHYQLLNIVLLYLGDDTRRDKLINLLQLIFKDEIAAAEKRKRLKKNYNIDLLPTDEKELMTMCNLSTGIYEDGIKKGKAEGLIEGEDIGTFKTLKLSVETMMKNFGVTAEQAIATFNLSPDDSKRLAAMLG